RRAGPLLAMRHADARGGPALATRLRAEPPAPQMMGAGDAAGPYRLRDPHLVHEVTDLRLHAEEIAGGDAEATGILRVEPERVLVGDLIEPLGVARAGMDERGETEGREKEHLALGPIDGRPVDVTAPVARHGVLLPLP